MTVDGAARPKTHLAPMHCNGCGAAVPLVAATSQPCPYCGAHVATPPNYLEAVAGRQAADAARLAAEPKWRKLAAGSSPRWKVVGGTLLVIAPPAMTAIGLSMEPAYAAASVFALFTLPSLFPGGILFVWGATADLAREGIRNVIAARPGATDGSPPGCRVCAAPLAVGAGHLSATCLYCGTDSIIVDVPRAAIAGERRAAVSSLADATRKLRLRLWLVRLALLALAAFVVGLSGALYTAQLALR